MISCGVCGKNNIIKKFSSYDDRFGYNGEFELLRCCSCGHIFLHHGLTLEQLSDLYSNYYPRSKFDLENYIPYQKERGVSAWINGAKSAAFRWVPERVRVLDIGCGFGQSLGYHASRGCEVYGVEVDKNIQRVADKFGYNVHVGLFDPNMYENGFFDYITMHQVLEHFTDPVWALQGVKRILKSNGVVVLTIPNADGWGAKVFGKRWINWHTPYHLHFFSKKSMVIAAEKSGLVIETMKTVTSSEWLYYQWNHLACYPCVGNSSVFWDPSKKPAEKEQKRLNRISRIHRATKVNHIFTRLFDLIGLGDNILYVLKNKK